MRIHYLLLGIIITSAGPNTSYGSKIKDEKASQRKKWIDRVCSETESGMMSENCLNALSLVNENSDLKVELQNCMMKIPSNNDSKTVPCCGVGGKSAEPAKKQSNEPKQNHLEAR